MSVDLKFDYEEALSRNPKYKIEDLTELRKWIEDQESTSLIPKNIHEKQLLLFYNACLLNLDDTKKCMKSYYTLRNSVSDHFNDRHLEDESMKEIINTTNCFIFPDETDEGYIVFLHRFRNTTPEKFYPAHMHKLIFMTLEAYLYEYGPPKGLIVMFDVEGLGFGHMRKVPFGLLTKFIKYLQEAIPLSLKGIYIINANSILHRILSFVRPFVKKEIFQLLHIHSNGDDYEEFFKDRLNKKCIPPDFGGDSSDTQLLHDENCEKLNSLRYYFDDEEKCRREYKEKVEPKTTGRRWF